MRHLRSSCRRRDLQGEEAVMIGPWKKTTGTALMLVDDVVAITD